MGKRSSTRSSTTKSAPARRAGGAPARAKAGGPAARPKTGGREGTAAPTRGSAAGRQLVIVESPAKAKTINKYLGPEYVVQASIGHVRDLPAKAPKGTRQPVPGVDLESDFRPTYEVLPGKKKTVQDLKRLAKEATEVWFATDLDREGEAIAWHLAQELGIRPADAKRVVFNAITKAEIQRAFQHPHPIDEDKVNAQQARRILDRIVGYQVSPLLWRKVARGLSAGRVQSVAVRLIVEREREIRAFIPEEYWRIDGRFTLDGAMVDALSRGWAELQATRDEKDRAPSIRSQNEWLTQHAAIRAELHALNGEPFALRSTGEAGADLEDLSARARDIAEACGLTAVEIRTEQDPRGRGPARFRRTLSGGLAPGVRYAVRSIEQQRTTTRPPAPFITSTLQMAASSVLSFGAQRTMRAAQALYEGVDLPGEGQTGLITYMRTDSTHVSGEALEQVRRFIRSQYGDAWLPEKPNFFGSTNAQAQEAHEAIRPTDVSRRPEDLERSLPDDLRRLYRLIWTRFVASQMAPAAWDGTSVLLDRVDRPTGATFRATGRVLAFDGFYRVAGVPVSADEQNLPGLAESQDLFPFSIDPVQCFTAPARRYSEASLVKKLEQEGIGRPSTYAAIIQVIQDREYVRLIERSFQPTDLGEIVTDKLIEAFPRLMDLGYTREMEAELDKVAEQHHDWIAMLRAFYGPFTAALDDAMTRMTHAKAEIVPARWQCPKCGARTSYRFGKNGRFLSCSAYPACDFASPIDMEGRPVRAERVDVRCPEDGSPMELRTGRFGRFLASVNYPATKFVLNLDRKGGIKLPAQPPVLTDIPCAKCGKPLNVRRGKRGPWLGCSAFPKCRGREAWTKLEKTVQDALLRQLEANDVAHPPIVVTRLDGRPIAEGTPLADLMLPGATEELEIHPDALAEDRTTEAA